MFCLVLLLFFYGLPWNSRINFVAKRELVWINQYVYEKKIVEEWFVAGRQIWKYSWWYGTSNYVFHKKKKVNGSYCSWQRFYKLLRCIFYNCYVLGILNSVNALNSLKPYDS